MTAARRYVTILATVEVPDDDVWDQIITSEVTGLLQVMGLPLAPCDFTIDVDTLTDGLGAEYGTVTLLDLNPPRVHPVEVDPDCFCDAGILDGHLASCPLSVREP